MGKGLHKNFLRSEAGGLLQNAIYIYIYAQNSLFGGSEKERFLDRFLIGFWIGFWRGFWRGFGEVFSIRVGFRHPLEVVFS